MADAKTIIDSPFLRLIAGNFQRVKSLALFVKKCPSNEAELSPVLVISIQSDGFPSLSGKDNSATALISVIEKLALTENFVIFKSASSRMSAASGE